MGFFSKKKSSYPKYSKEHLVDYLVTNCDTIETNVNHLVDLYEYGEPEKRITGFPGTKAIITKAIDNGILDPITFVLCSFILRYDKSDDKKAYVKKITNGFILDDLKKMVDMYCNNVRKLKDRDFEQKQTAERTLSEPIKYLDDFCSDPNENNKDNGVSRKRK